MRLAFNAAGVLYGFASDGVLYTINTGTGAYTQVGTQTVKVTNRGNVIMPANGDIAFAPDGTFFAAVSCTGGATANVCLYSVNPTGNPTATELGNLITLPNGAVIASLAYGIGGTLYAGASNGAYISVNTASGAGTLIATNAGSAYWDFASMPKFANLSVTKTASSTPVIAGGTLTYTLRVTNNGAHAATNIRLTDVLPSSALYRSHTAPTGWTCTTPAVGANGTVACTNGTNGSLANGANADITVTVSAPTTVGTLANTAFVMSDTIDDVATNDNATVTTTVNPATISGIVFEDVNYGGGAGRSLSSSGGTGRGGARVELYNSSGAFVSFTTTATTGTIGAYSFQSNGSNTTINNTITANGRGTGANVETAGVRVYGNNNTIERNIIAGNYGAGVMVTPGAGANLITRNSIFNNGTIVNNGGTAASNQSGINLQTSTDNVSTGTSPYVTLNDANDTDTGGNGLLNFPVLERATVSGGQLTLTGFARPAASLELFIAAPDASGFGEGQTYLVTLIEGSAADTDATNATYTSPFAGRTVGTDTTERFSFTITLPNGVTLGSTLTATATVSGSTSEFSNLITIANAPPAVSLIKSVSPEGDITPGTDLTYTIAFTNTGGQSATGFRIIDPDPASSLRLNLNSDFKVASALATPGTSGLTAVFEYSNDNAATWTYTPASAAGGAPVGYDRNVTHVRWIFTGSLSQTAPNNAGSVSFVVRVR